MLQPIQLKYVKLIVSLYADDEAIFLNPTTQCIGATTGASGLVTSLPKCAFYQIAYDPSSLAALLDGIPCEVKAFPCKYLVMPLNVMPLCICVEG